VFSPEAVEGVLRAAGFELPAQAEISMEQDLDEVCSNIGYPVVMKVVGPLHKSDVGGVKVGLSNKAGGHQAWKE